MFTLTTCDMPCVTCHVSHDVCHMSLFSSVSKVMELVSRGSVIKGPTLFSSFILSKIFFSGAVRACEGKSLDLSCGSGKHIDVVSANYGRLGTTYCQHSAMSNTNCRSSNSLSVVRARCQGRSSCSVPATNSVFGDPCYGTHKYMEVYFSCKPESKSIKGKHFFFFFNWLVKKSKTHCIFHLVG